MTWSLGQIVAGSRVIVGIVEVTGCGMSCTLFIIIHYDRDDEPSRSPYNAISPPFSH